MSLCGRDNRFKLTEEGFMCQLSSGSWVPYIFPPPIGSRELYEAQKQKLVKPQTSLPSSPSYVPWELYEAQKQKLVEPQTSLPSAPSYVPWELYEAQKQKLVEPQTSLPSSPSYVPWELYEAQKQKLVEPQTSLPSAPSHPDDDGLVPRSPCVPPYSSTMPFTPPPSALLKARDKIPPWDLLGKVGLHCYNLQNGTNLPLRNVFIMRIAIDTGIVTTSRDFQARVRYNEIEKERCSTMITTLSRFMPPKTPGTTSEVEGDLCAAFDRLAVDDFFKDDMPHWVPQDATHNLQYYEMEDSEVEEYKEWLHLYAEIAYFTTLGRFLEELRWAQPFELTKVIVQTREDVESKKKAKAENAIFYIAFKTRAVGREYYAIIRRTMDGRPEHMSLEVKCFKKI